MSQPITLDRLNWTIWKKAIEINCLKKGAKKNLTATDDKESKEEGTAQSIILDSLNTEDQYLVSTCESAKDMMDKLEKRYKQSINVYTVTKELADLKWTSAMNAEQFVNRLNDVRARYKTVVNNATDDAFTIKLISELPNDMEAIRTHYEFLMCDEAERKRVSYEVICNRILMACRRESEPSEYVESGRATHVAMVSQALSCHNCQKTGHFYYECPMPLIESLKRRLKSRLEHAKKRAGQRSDGHTARHEQTERTAGRVRSDGE